MHENILTQRHLNNLKTWQS